MLHMHEVTGSSPVVPTTASRQSGVLKCPPFGRHFPFAACRSFFPKNLCYANLFREPSRAVLLHRPRPYCEPTTGLEGGGDYGSNRFAGELQVNKSVCRKLHQPGGLCTGARRQRRESCCPHHVAARRVLQRVAERQPLCF